MKRKQTAPTKTRKRTKPAARARNPRGAFRAGLLSALLLVLSVALHLHGQQVKLASADLPSAPNGMQWQQVWADEFSGSSVDTAKWNVQNNSNYGASNHEDQCYSSNNVAVSGGMLRLIGKKETVSCGGTNPDTGNSTYYFTSGMVTSRAQGGALKFKFNKGYIETRAKAPKGNPFWPAFWLVSPNDGSTPGWPDYGEFDIFELYGIRPDVTNGSMHYKCTDADGHCQLNPTWYNIKADSAYGGQSNLGTQITTQAAMDAYTGGTTDFNTYGFLWEADKLTWYVNGRKTRYFDGTNLYRIEQNGNTTFENSTATLGQPAIPFSTVFNYDHSINLNMAAGGDGPRYSAYGYTGQDTAGGYNDGNLVMQDPATMEIDYVRLYQLATVPQQPSTPTPPTPTPTTPTTPTTTTPEPEKTTPSSDAPVTITTAGGDQVDVAKDNKTVDGDTVLNPALVTDKTLQATVKKVEYYLDGKLAQTDSTPPYKFDTSKVADGTYTVTEKIYFKDGKTQETKAKITIKNVATVKKRSWLPMAIGIGSAVAAVVALELFWGRRITTFILRRLSRR
jgi:beta-glucanase (GH16 family)